jgi:hypothetical protein
MKVRKGFVSNSSSSSFICEICGEKAEGMDISLSEADMFQCENGHTMCTEHALKDLTCGGHTDEEDEEDEFDLYEIDEACCPICNYQEISYDDAREYLKKKYGVSEDLVFQKIKEINKRRKKLYSEEYVHYVFEQEGLTDDKFIEIIKLQFPSYKDYKNFKGD